MIEAPSWPSRTRTSTSHDGVNLRAIAPGASSQRRLRAASSRAARPSPSSWSRTRCGRPEQNLDRKTAGGVLAVALEKELHEGRDPRALPQHRLLRQRRLRRAGGGRDLLRQRRRAARLGQAALLAGLIRNPVGYDPIRYPERRRATPPGGPRPAGRGRGVDRRGRPSVRRRRPRRRPAPADPAGRPTTTSSRRSSSSCSTTRLRAPGGPREAERYNVRVRRRAQDLHDVRPGRAGPGDRRP